MTRKTDTVHAAPALLVEHLVARIDVLEREQARLRAAFDAHPTVSTLMPALGDALVAGMDPDTVFRDAQIVTEQGPGLRITSGGSGLQIESRAVALYAGSTHEPAIYAETTGADAVVASSLDAQGAGVHALGGSVRGGMGTSPRPCGVFAEGGSGDGIYATGEETAVHGVSATGYGASFAGGRAPLHLALAATAGAPTSGVHRPGTLFVDVQATLWLCVAGGTPGLWKRIVVQ